MPCTTATTSFAFTAKTALPFEAKEQNRKIGGLLCPLETVAGHCFASDGMLSAGSAGTPG